MIRYRLSIQIVPRRGLLDPQGKAVADALHSMGFSNVVDVHIGRYLVLHVDAIDEATARRHATEMCERLLANPVTEDFDIAVVSVA